MGALIMLCQCDTSHADPTFHRADCPMVKMFLQLRHDLIVWQAAAAAVDAPKADAQ